MGSAYEPALKKARIFDVPASLEVNGSGAAAVNGFVNNIALVNDGSISGMDQHAALNGDLECRRFSSMEGCPYGTKCRFKHGASDERNVEQPVSALGSKTKPCTKFFSTSGCPYGEGCHFLHYVPGGIAALGLMPWGVTTTKTVGAILTPISSGLRNTIGGYGPTTSSPIPTLSSPSDPSVTVGGYKTRLCNKFNTAEGCRFGDRCHFAHGKNDLRPSNARCNDLDYMQGTYTSNGGAGGTHLLPPVASAIYYGEPTPPGVATSTATFGVLNSTTKMCIDAVLAGAIIGKAGANVKQISRLTGCKLSIRDHESDTSMRCVEMEGSYEQIERATNMVRQFLSHREVVPQRTASLASHNFKTKLCENFGQGTCTFADRCHFAHGTHELRFVKR